MSLSALEILQYTAKVYIFRSIGTEWKGFAKLREIGLTSKLRDILQRPSTSSEKRGRVIIKSWLETCGPTATWKSLLQLLESSKRLEIVATVINQFFSAAALEERVYQLESREKEALLRKEKVILQREKEDIPRRKKDIFQRKEKETNELLKLERRLKVVEQDLVRIKGSVEEGCLGRS